MNIQGAFPSKYLSANADIPEEGDLVLTIKHVEIETVGQGAKAAEKPVLYFNEVGKGLVLNKTNAGTIGKLYGAETDAWTGKPVALFSTEVPFEGKQVLAIRVRVKAPKAAAAPAAVGVDKMAWIEWCGDNDITESIIRQALGTAKITEWLAQNKALGATLDDAKNLILVAKSPF